MTDTEQDDAPALVRTRWRAPVSWVPVLTAVLVAALYTATSVRRHVNLETGGFDLGIFTQDVRSWAELHVPPVSTLKGPDFNRFGDHFSPSSPSWRRCTASSRRP